MLSVMMMAFVASCDDDDDDYDTNQFTKGVSLSSFGPSPVARGGELRFVGSNLDKIVAVDIPGSATITDITVKTSGVPSEISVTVPQDAEVGLVTLTASDGTVLTTKTELTYTEPISLDSFSPAEVMPGDELTIEGDYLNLIHAVIFADEVTVSDSLFISQARDKIVLMVPDSARTGQIIISDGEEDPNLIYSADTLKVGTSTVTSFKADRFKSGETITIVGTRFDLVKAVRFYNAGGEEVDVTEFTLSDDGTTITLTQPAEAAQAAVMLVQKSDVEVEACTADDFAVVVPTELEIASETVKNGNSLTISGNDLDLVTGVTFASEVDGGSFTIDDSGNLVIASIPSTAVTGDLTLSMANGMTVTVSYTLVTPTVTEYSSSPVNAGTTLTITGTDLDLVSTVTFNGSEEAVTPTSISATEIVLTVAMDATSGAVTLNLINGATVTAASLDVNAATFCYVSGDWPEEVVAGELITVTVTNADALTSVDVNDRVGVQYILIGTTLYISTAETDGKSTSITLHSEGEGDITYTYDVTPATEITTVIWTGAFDLGSWANGFEDLAYGRYDFSFLTAGMDLVFYFDEYDTETWWQLKVAHGNGWAALTGFGTDGIAYLNEGDASLTVTLTADMVSELQDYGLILQGANLIISQIAVVEHISLETSIVLASGTYGESEYWTFPVAMDWSAGARFVIYKDTPVDLSSYVKVGATLRFYASGIGQIQINDANWNTIEYVSEWSEDGDHVFEVTLTQDYVDAYDNGDGWSTAWLICQGSGLTVTDVTIE